MQPGRDLKEQTEGMEKLIERVQSIVSTSNLERLLIRIVEEAPALVDGAGCTIYLIPELVPAYTGKLMREGREIDVSILDRELIVLAETSRDERRADIGRAFYLKGEGLTGWIFEHGRPLQLCDMRNGKELHSYDPALHWADAYEGSKRWYQENQPQPFLGVPLRGARKVFGVIKVPATINKQPFPPYATELFMSFAGVLSTLIRKTKLLEDLTSSISELLSISTTAEEQAQFDKIVDVAAQLIDGRDLGLYLLDAFGERIALRATQGDYLKRMLAEGKCGPYRRGEGLTGWVFKTGKPLCIKDIKRYKEPTRLLDQELNEISNGTVINDEDRWIQWQDKDEEFVHSNDPAFLAVPIKAEDGSVLGVLRAPAVTADPRWGGELFFDAEDLRVFESFADSVALFLQSMRRKQLGDMLIEQGSILAEEELFQFVVERTPRLVRARGCSILLMEHSREEKPLVLRYTSSPALKEPTGQVRDLAYELGQGKTGFAAEAGKALVINYYGPGELEAIKLIADHERYTQKPGNLVDYLLDSEGTKVGLIRLVGAGPQNAQQQESFKKFVRTQQLKKREGLPSPHGPNCETGHEQGAISFLAVPIKDHRGQVQGVIRLPRTDEGSYFSDEDLDLLESIANRLTITLHTLELLQSNQERSEKLEKLSSSIRTLVGQLWAEKLETRLETIVDAAAEILGAEVCSLWQVKRPGYIQLIASHGEVAGKTMRDDGTPVELPILVGIGTGLTGYIAAGDQSLRLHADRLRGHLAVICPDDQPHIPSGGCYSLLAIPLKRELVTQDGRRSYETIGLLKAENKRDEHGEVNPLMEFTPEDESVLTVIAETVVTILDNARYIQELEALQRMGAEVTGLLAVDEVLPMLLVRLQEILSPEYVRISLYDTGRGLVEASVGERTPYMRPDAFPIKIQHEEIGRLEVHHVSPREIQTLQRFITQAAVAIRNAQLFEQAESRRRKLQKLADISAGLIEFTSQESLFQRIVASAAELVSAEDCSLFLVDPVRDTIDLKASSVLPPDLLDSRLARVGAEPRSGLTAHVAATGQILNLANGEHLKHPAWSGEYQEHIKYLPSGRSHSVLLVPLRQSGEQIIGVLKVENKKGQNPEQGFRDDQELLTTLANQAVIAIRNTRLHETRAGELQRQVDRLIALRDIDNKIVSVDDLGAILRAILDQARSHSRMECHAAMIALHYQETGGWKVQACCGQEIDWNTALTTDEAIQRAVEGNRGTEESLEWPGLWKLAVPVRRAHVCGILAMQGRGEQSWLEEDLRWLEGLAGQTAIAVEREERRRELARTEEQKEAAGHALMISGLWSIFAHDTTNAIGTIPRDVDELRALIGSVHPDAEALLNNIKRSAETMMSTAMELRQRDFQKGEAVAVEALLRAAKARVNIPDSIQVRTRGVRKLPPVLVPPLTMQAIFANILRNAVQAIQATGASSGRISVQCRAVPDRQQVVVEIRDTGCGFDELEYAQLFEPVWLKPSPTEKGMGYALWWAKTLVTVLGGGISAESEGLDQGATFRVWLPTEPQ